MAALQSYHLFGQHLKHTKKEKKPGATPAATQSGRVCLDRSKALTDHVGCQLFNLTVRLYWLHGCQNKQPFYRSRLDDSLMQRPSSCNQSLHDPEPNRICVAADKGASRSLSGVSSHSPSDRCFDFTGNGCFKLF